MVNYHDFLCSTSADFHTINLTENYYSIKHQWSLCYTLLTILVRHTKLVVMSNTKSMTPKQSAFAGFVASGDKYTDAYRKAYNTDTMSDRSIRNASSRLANQEHIREAIQALKAQDRTAIKAHEKLGNDWVIERLQAVILDEDNPASARVRALELLGKKGKLFDDSTHVTVENRSPEELEKELVEKLSAFFGDSSVIN